MSFCLQSAHRRTSVAGTHPHSSAPGTPGGASRASVDAFLVDTTNNIPKSPMEVLLPRTVSQGQRFVGKQPPRRRHIETNATFASILHR